MASEQLCTSNSNSKANYKICINSEHNRNCNIYLVPEVKVLASKTASSSPFNKVQVSM